MRSLSKRCKYFIAMETKKLTAPKLRNLFARCSDFRENCARIQTSPKLEATSLSLWLAAVRMRCSRAYFASCHKLHICNTNVKTRQLQVQELPQTQRCQDQDKQGIEGTCSWAAISWIAWVPWLWPQIIDKLWTAGRCKFKHETLSKASKEATMLPRGLAWSTFFSQSSKSSNKVTKWCNMTRGLPGSCKIFQGGRIFQESHGHQLSCTPSTSNFELCFCNLTLTESDSNLSCLGPVLESV